MRAYCVVDEEGNILVGTVRWSAESSIDAVESDVTGLDDDWQSLQAAGYRVAVVEVTVIEVPNLVDPTTFCEE